MSPLGFEHTISEGERPQTHALDCAAIASGNSHINKALLIWLININSNKVEFTVNKRFFVVLQYIIQQDA